MEPEEPQETVKEVKDEPTDQKEEEPTKGAEPVAVQDDEADLEDKIVPPEPDALEEPSGLIEPDEQALVAPDEQMEDAQMDGMEDMPSNIVHSEGVVLNGEATDEKDTRITTRFITK